MVNPVIIVPVIVPHGASLSPQAAWLVFGVLAVLLAITVWIAVLTLLDR